MKGLYWTFESFASRCTYTAYKGRFAHYKEFLDGFQRKKKRKKERKEEKKVKKRKSRGRVSFEKEDDDVIYEFRTLSLLEASTNYYY